MHSAPRPRRRSRITMTPPVGTRRDCGGSVGETLSLTLSGTPAPEEQAIGDLNGDGRDDLAVSNDGELGVQADDVIRIYLQE
jgi:hypothetical protein